MLHVANGDHALGVLRAAALPGDVVAWSDVLDQGPLRGVPGTPEFREARAQWLSANGAGTPQQLATSGIGCYSSADLKEADDHWVGSTPTFFLNGRRLVGLKQLRTTGVDEIERLVKLRKGSS